MLKPRLLAGKSLNPLGLGCMNLSHAYGVPPTPEVGQAVLKSAFEQGYRHFDTAALYGFGKNETLVGEALKPFRREIFLASKCGMTGVEGVRVIDGRPQTLKRTIDESLKRLQTDHIDLYYLHRWDKSVPIEESVGAMKDMVVAGKIGAIGLSEVSSLTLKKAHTEAAIAALQTEYSLWTRNAEIAVLETCGELGIAFVAFSPVARGFLADAVSDTNLVTGDIRNAMPRFQTAHFEKNIKLLPAFRALAKEAGVTPAQLALAWVLAQGAHVHVIPGTTSVAHLDENMQTPAIEALWLSQASDLINQQTVSGPRYPESIQVEIDTEEFG